MNMFAQKNNPDYVDTNRPEMLLRNRNIKEQYILQLIVM